MPKGDSGIERSEDDGEVVQSSTCVIPLNLKASFVQPLRRLRRQLSWQESPWQRGVVLLRLIEVCWKTSRNAKASPTRKDSPGRGRWHASAERGTAVERMRD